MTNKEAIRHLDTYSSTNGSGLTTQKQHEEAKRMAINALKKQIQKKPMIRIDVYNDNKNLCHLYCPTCGTWIGLLNKRQKWIDMHNNTNGDICAECGQAIDTDFKRWENDN